MPNCMKCRKQVLAAKVLCSECEKRSAQIIAALGTAICGTCYRLGRNDLDRECRCCEPIRLLQELKKEWC